MHSPTPRVKLNHASRQQSSNELSDDIISRLDVRSEYESLGVQFTASKPTAKGWIACSAYGRDDKKASAAVHVESGVYKDHGSNLICGLFDFAVHTGEFPDWKAARKHYAIKTKMDKRLPKSETKEDHLLSKFDFNNKWNGLLARGLVSAFPGISDLSLQRAGSQLAHYPKSALHPHLVVTLPVFGVYLADRPPVGYVVMMVNGKPLELYRGKDVPPDYVKRAVMGDTGLVNRRGVEMIADGRAELVLKVEGVTGMLAMQAKIPDEWIDKVAVVANACGAQESTLPRLISPVFSGIPVVVIHDADVPGQTGAKVWEGELNKFTSSVNLQLPYVIVEKGGKDLRDWLNEGNEFEDLLDLIRRQFPGWLESKGEQQATEIARQDTTEAKPKAKSVQKTIEDIPFDADNADPDKLVKSLIINRPAPIGGPTEADAPTPPPAIVIDNTISQEAAILKRLGMVVIGMPVGTTEIVGFCTRTGRTFKILQINALTFVGLMQHLGGDIRQEINRPGAEPIPNRLTFDTVKEAIAIEACSHPLTSESYLGVGIWGVGNQIVLVNGGEATIVGDEISRIKIPMLGGKVLEMTAEKKWFDHEWFVAEFDKSLDCNYGLDILNRAINVFARWDNWKHSSNPLLVVGLVCVTWIQSMIAHRPHPSIVGSSNSGKTTLLDTLRQMFCQKCMSISSSSPSAAGIRAAIGNTSKALIIDELESTNPHTREVLNMFRVMSKGDVIMRSTGDQRLVTYKLKCLPWHGAISTDFESQADRNRYLMLELTPLKKGQGSTLQIPSPEELEQLGLQLMVLAVRHYRRSEELSAAIKGVYFESIDRRIVESFSVPCGMIAAIRGMTEDEAIELTRKVLIERDLEEQSEADEVTLLQKIFESTIQLSNGSRTTISALLQKYRSHPDPEADEAFTRYGIRPVSKSIGGSPKQPCLFFCPNSIKLNLFTDPADKRVNVGQILARVTGAFQGDKQRMGVHAPRGVTIPLAVIESLLGGGTESSVNPRAVIEGLGSDVEGDFSDA